MSCSKRKILCFKILCSKIVAVAKVDFCKHFRFWQCWVSKFWVSKFRVSNFEVRNFEFQKSETQKMSFKMQSFNMWGFSFSKLQNWLGPPTPKGKFSPLYAAQKGPPTNWRAFPARKAGWGVGEVKVFPRTVYYYSANSISLGIALHFLREASTPLFSKNFIGHLDQKLAG